jgi:hypothetical protein
MKFVLPIGVALALGGCAFAGKVSQGIQCNEPQSAAHPLVRPPMRVCQYWLGGR